MTKTSKKSGRRRARPVKPKRKSSAGVLKFLAPGKAEWRDLTFDADDKDDDALERAAEESNVALKDALLTSLQMPNLIALAGSGTSIGGKVGGPSMWVLWDRCVHKDPDTDRDDHENTETASSVIETIEFDEGQNIEALLSRCEAYLVIHDDEDVEDFAIECKRVILESCSEFLEDCGAGESNLEAHKQFLHRLSRRRVRDPRLKLFTTNYDCLLYTSPSPRDS